MNWPRPKSRKVTDDESTAAKVRFRVKGETDGPVYQGQKLIAPCRGCASKQPENLALPKIVNHA